MSQHPKVSVHIVTFNSGVYIRSCIEAVLEQSYPKAVKIVVVDNDSRDETLSILDEFEDRIEVIRNSDNRGFAGGHNQAIRLTDSDFFLVLNPDVVLHRDYVRELVQEMGTRPDIGSATGLLVRSSDPDIVDSTGIVMTRSRRAFDRGQGERTDRWKQPGEVFGVSGAAAMYRRAMAAQIQDGDEFFDEQFFAYKEDVDVAWRARLAGWTAYYVPAARAHHERGWKQGARTQQPLFVRRHSYINRYYMMMKNDRLRDMLRHAPWLLSYEIVILAYFILREPKVLGAWRDFFRHLGSMLRKRQANQSMAWKWTANNKEFHKKGHH